MPIKLKTVTIEGKTYAEMAEGKPIYIHDDGKDVPFDAEATIGTISRLNGEAKGHREAKEAAETKLKAFEGIEDADAAKKALETVKNLDEGKLLSAGKVEEIKKAARVAAEETVAQVNKEAANKLKVAEDREASLMNQLYTEKIGGSFLRSKFIGERVAIPADMVQARFGQQFKIEDGKIVAYQLDGSKVYSRAKPGEVADFEEAIELLVDGYPNRDHILKGNGGGTGARGGSGGGAGARQITRAAFDQLPHAERAAKMKEGVTVVDG